VHWSKRLAKPIKLASGVELVTLRDAGEFVRDHFQGYTKNDALECAVELLLAAVETGRLKERRAATAQVEILIGTHPWL